MHNNKKALLTTVLIVSVVTLCIVVAGIITELSQKPVTSSTVQNTQNTQQAASPTNVEGLQLDTVKNYGNKYADGLLPVGDK